jgi:AcrR family transcriptional regulator
MSTSTRSSYHHGQLRPALIAEARALLDAGGPSAVSLREAARRAGVSATATYRHFADKEALLAAVAAEGFHQFAEALAAPMREGKDFSAMGRAYVEFALKHEGLFRLMFSPLIRERERHPELAAATALAYEALHSGVAGEWDGGEQEIGAIAVSLWSLVHGFSHLLLDGVLPIELAPELIDGIFRLPLKPRQP